MTPERPEAPTATAASEAPPRQPGASTLAARLCAGILVVATIAVLLAVWLVLRQSRDAIENETEAAQAYARIALEEAPIAGDTAWAASLGQLRHLCVALDELGTYRCEHAPAKGVPRWFERAVNPGPATLHGLLRNGTPISVVVHPRDELRESWQETRGLLAMIVAAGAATVLLVYATLRMSLAPVDAVMEALDRAGRGDYERRLRPTGSLELRNLAAGVNKLTDSLEQTAADNRRLLQRGLDVQETERRWIARELHDDIGQYLTALEVDLAVAEREAQRLSAPGFSEPLGAARENVGHVFDAVHGLLDRLRPAALEELGLAPALSQLAQDWQRRLPQVRVRDEVDQTVAVDDADTAMHLYRIAQECFVNAARHSQASEVRVAFRRDGDALLLTVADDGRGFDPDGPRRRGLGLRGMRERVAVLRGRMEVAATPERGSCVEVRVPA